jgi:hypothetical protein
VSNPDARDHPRVAKYGRREGEVIEKSNSGAKKKCRDVDVEFVEETSVQQLLDGVGAVYPDGLPGGSGFGLVHGAFDAVGHEVDIRVGSWPSDGNVVSQDKCRPPRVIAAPAVGNVERASAGEHGTKLGPQAAKVLSARRGHLECHGVRPPCLEFDVPRIHVPVEHLSHAIVAVGDEAVE